MKCLLQIDAFLIYQNFTKVHKFQNCKYITRKQEEIK